MSNESKYFTYSVPLPTPHTMLPPLTPASLISMLRLASWAAKADRTADKPDNPTTSPINKTRASVLARRMKRVDSFMLFLFLFYRLCT